jgi:hypothetical protein
MSSGSPSISSSTPSQTPPPPLVPTWLIVIGAISVTIVIIIVVVTLFVKPKNQGPSLMSNADDNEFYHTNEYSKIGGYFYFD